MELAKKKKKIVKEQPFNPEVDTGLGRPVRSRVAVGDVMISIQPIHPMD